MYLFVMDESGDKDKPGAGATDLYVLGGVAIPDYRWPDITFHLETVKHYYEVDGWPEVKWRHLWGPYLPSVLPDRKQPLVAMPRSRRLQLARGILEIVAKRPDLVVFVVVLDKAKLLGLLSATHSVSDEDFRHEVYSRACTSILQSLDLFLAKAPGLPFRLACVYQDEEADQKGSRYARDFFHGLLQVGTYFTRFKTIVETLSLVPSHHSVGVQLADFCVGAVMRQITGKNPELYAIIDANVNKTRKGKVYGLRWLP